MDCFVPPGSILKSKCMGSRHAYRHLPGGDEDAGDIPAVTVVVGREKREFLVEPFVLEENPFRVLIVEAAKKKSADADAGGGLYRRTTEQKQKQKKKRKKNDGGVVFVDVDEILFEHMLWLMYNDCSSFFNLNVKEIIDFYAQDY